jgi:NitT/TauT family transport system substrate-binding protein
VHEQGVRAVTVAAIFQKDPLVMIGHPAVFSRMEDLRGKTILISSDARTNYWPWLRSKYGLEDRQIRPYTFNVQPFIADKGTVQQGYLSSEPFAIEKQAGFKPTALLLADHGWPPYATTVVCMEETLRNRPKAVAAFLQATMEGWRSYLRDDPSPANALIKRDNPQMTDEQIAYGIRMMKQMELVSGGDAARMGIGAMTPERLKATFDMMVAMKLIDPAKVDFRRTFNADFIKNIRVMP